MQNKHQSDPSAPNLILNGHTSQPTYALGWSTEKPILASGGQNGNIVIWNLESRIDAQKGFSIDSSPEMKDEMGAGKISRSCKQNS